MTDGESWANLPLLNNLSATNPEELEPQSASRVMSWEVAQALLAEPVAARVTNVGNKDMPIKHSDISIREGRPILFPREISERIEGRTFRISMEDAGNPLLQYLYLAIVKGAGGYHNSAITDVWFHRHVYRSRHLLKDAKGLVLDIGCDDPALSRLLFPPAVSYLGLDPLLGPRSELCLAGMAEFLPIQSGSLDGVAMLTSLDHVLDHHSAIDEAFRVLRPGGSLYLATLIWAHGAELMRDGVHFHHFRQFEIEGCLRSFTIEKINRYSWKDDSHRFGVYLCARKPG